MFEIKKLWRRSGGRVKGERRGERERKKEIINKGNVIPLGRREFLDIVCVRNRECFTRIGTRFGNIIYYQCKLMYKWFQWWI